MVGREGITPSLKNTYADMEIGYVYINAKAQLYIQVGRERQYYGTLKQGKDKKLLEMIKKWDAAGGNDECTT